MKEFLKKILASVLACMTVFALASCNSGKDDGDFTARIYVPDGAPALSLAKLMHDEEEHCDFNVVSAEVITSKVTGTKPDADLCVLPLNIASKVIGDGENYTMLGTVTHGNLYLISTNPKQYTSASQIATLSQTGAIGTIQLNNVPGLVLRSLLYDNDRGVNLDYRYPSTNNEIFVGEVSPAEISPTLTLANGTLPAHFFLVAEPLASAKVKATANTANPFHIVGDMQALYGDGTGFPQAVLVVKNDFLQEHEDWVQTFMTKVQDSATWVKTADIQTVCTAIAVNLLDGAEPVFKVANLTSDVIERCNVRFVDAQTDKARIQAFLEKMAIIDSNAVGTLADKFFYDAN